MNPEEPFDLTRANEYQGKWNRAGVAMNIAFAVFVVLLGFAFATMGLLAGAPWGWWVVSAFIVLVGSVSFAYWYRAFRKSRPPS